MQAIIFTGIQGSGKSTFYKQYFFNSHVRISMDLLNTRNKENIFLNTCFTIQQRFVVDNTNPTAEERKKYIEQAKANKYEVIGYYFETELPDAIRRNNLRLGKEKISEKGIRACFYKMKQPKFEEGFDRLFEVKIGAGNDFEVKELEKK